MERPVYGGGAALVLEMSACMAKGAQHRSKCRHEGASRSAWPANWSAEGATGFFVWSLPWCI